MVQVHDLHVQLEAKVVLEHNLTGIVVRVTVFVSLRISTGSSWYVEPESVHRGHDCGFGNDGEVRS